MTFYGLRLYFTNLAIILLLVPTTSSLKSNSTIPQTSCLRRCGNLEIPYPFGTTPDCYENNSFRITCNQTFDPPKAFLQSSDIEITYISLDGQLRVLQFIAHECYNRNRTQNRYNGPSINLPDYLTVNNTANKFTIVGCDTYGFVSGQRLDRGFMTGCTATCGFRSDVAAGSCTGIGCCQMAIPKDVWSVDLNLRSYDNYSDVWDFDRCGYAFLVEESAFAFHAENLTNLSNVERLPMVIDWAIGNGTCEEAQRNGSSYACKSVNSKCYKPNNGDGYRCSCADGYRGNPYLVDGCQDIDECHDPNIHKCEQHCVNTPGSFNCTCDRGYHGDGRKGGQGCIRDQSNTDQSLALKLVAGIAIGVIAALVAACWLYFVHKRRRIIKTRQKFFLHNGGILFQEKITRREISADIVKIFSESELQRATNNFDNSMIIGRGGFGVVYKGLLPDNKIVAVKKSKELDPNQIEQFINEVIVLSQINHRNVVKLLGCCLETQVPLLVYELINNGTLFEHVHNKSKARYLTWDMRLKIATETASVLSYLHSVASTPIIHRDVKSANILLDHTFTAKVSDFGASRLVPLDQTHLNTMVQGTFGYLDPEYLQTHQLTEKSDVYSFGVVLAELLTGEKALSFNRSEVEQSLANYFLFAMKQERLFRILEDNVAREGNVEHIKKVALLAKSCLNVRGDDRPSMREVAVELEGLRLAGKHVWLENENGTEVKESLLDELRGDFMNIVEGNSPSFGSSGLGFSTISTDGR